MKIDQRILDLILIVMITGMLIATVWLIVIFDKDGFECLANPIYYYERLKETSCNCNPIYSLFKNESDIIELDGNPFNHQIVSTPS